MNGSGAIQHFQAASHQAELRLEADTTRLAADAMFAAAAERTRHATSDERTRVGLPARAFGPVKRPMSASRADCLDTVADCREGSLAA